MTNYMRPDEQAAYSEIERPQSRDSNIKRGVKTAASVALGAAGLSSRILPFLSEYIPTELAMKGINKVSPQLGKFLQNGQKMGLNLKDGLDFIKDNIQEKQEPAKQSKNIIEQYSPELHKFIDQEVRKGQSGLQAGVMAHATGKFKKVIDSITKDHKLSWLTILENIYGKDPMANKARPRPENMQQQQGQQGQPQQGQSQAALQPEQMQQQQIPQQGQQQQPGMNDQDLLAAIDKVLKL